MMKKMEVGEKTSGRWSSGKKEGKKYSSIQSPMASGARF
jgi:hypothetical protein